MKKLNRNLAILYFIISLIIYIGYSGCFFIKNRVTSFDSNLYFLIYLFVNFLFVISVIYLTQYISISLVNKAAKVWDEVPCKYCGNEMSKLVCPACDSIQWNSKKGKLYSSIAIFLAHHRWKVINTILTLFLIGPLLFAVKFHFEEIDKITLNERKINTEIQNIIQFSNNIRPKLKNLMYRLEEKSVDKMTLIENREYLLGNYYTYAWELAEVVDYLKHNNEYRKKHEAYKVAISLIKKERLIPKLDKTFFDMIGNLNERINTNNLDNDSLLIVGISSLDKFTKGISCAIGEISFNPDANHTEKEIIDDCYEHINNVNKMLKLKSNTEN